MPCAIIICLIANATEIENIPLVNQKLRNRRGHIDRLVLTVFRLSLTYLMMFFTFLIHDEFLLMIFVGLVATPFIGFVVPVGLPGAGRPQGPPLAIRDQQGLQGGSDAFLPGGVSVLRGREGPERRLSRPAPLISGLIGLSQLTLLSYWSSSTSWPTLQRMSSLRARSSPTRNSRSTWACARAAVSRSARLL